VERRRGVSLKGAGHWFVLVDRSYNMKIKDAIAKATAETSAEQAKLLKRVACRAVLEYARIQQKTISYIELAEVLSMFSGGSELANVLGEIAKEDFEAGHPVITALAVRKDTGRPGKGFYTYLNSLGATLDIDQGEGPISLPLIAKGVYDPTMDLTCITFWADTVGTLLGPNVAVMTSADLSSSRIMFTGPRDPGDPRISTQEVAEP
jgi:hypothetical protein